MWSWGRSHTTLGHWGTLTPRLGSASWLVECAASRWGEALTSPRIVVITVQGDIQPHSGHGAGAGRCKRMCNVVSCEVELRNWQFLVFTLLGTGAEVPSEGRKQEQTVCRSWSCGPAAAAAPSTGPPPDNECKWLPSNIIFTSDWGAAANTNTRTTLKWQSFRHKVVEICGIDLSIVFFTT